MASTIRSERLGFFTGASEAASDGFRRAIEQLEPRSQRTYTPTGAVLSRSAGCYHFTPEGRRLADFTSGVLVANLGHHPVRWWKRVFETMGFSLQLPEAKFASGVPLTSYNAITEIEVEAARRLIANMRSHPGGGRMEQVLWAASGSEAVHKALKVSLAQRPHADVILATRHGFHGKKGLAGAVTGSERDEDRDPRVHFLHFPRTECASIERRREPINLAPYRVELQEMLDRFGDRICCLITEPYLGGGGSYHPQVEYIQLLEQFCRDHEILFILDEIQANFGRTGSMYAYTTYGVEPDMVLLGKGMANGVPVDAVVGSAATFAKLDYGSGSDTWSGHALGCAAVLATLDEFEQTDVLEHAAQLAEVLESGLVRLTELDAIEAVRGEGTVWGIHCAAIGNLTAAEVANEIVRACYVGDEQGRAIHLLGPLAQCVLRVAPPLVMPLAEAREYLETMYEIISQVTNNISQE